jgi:hypothetical protein
MIPYGRLRYPVIAEGWYRFLDRRSGNERTHGTQR